MRFLDLDWCGFKWTGWRPLTDEDSPRDVIPGPGLFRLRIDEDSLVYIGRTGKNLGEMIRLLRGLPSSKTMPHRAREAFPCLWTIRNASDAEYEISTAASERSKQEMMTIGCFLNWQYRVERGSSTPCNLFELRSNILQSKAGKGIKGDDVHEITIKRVESHPPLLPSATMESTGWMGLDWSGWEELNLRSVKRIPTLPGVYRIYDPERLEMLYLGESAHLRRRIQSHTRSEWGSKGLFSYHVLPKSLPEYHRREMENDLIGGYYLERIEPPRFQFKKR
jgi:hypothetical protein